MKAKTAIPVPVTQFKTHCLELIETVHRKRTSVVISKRGKPVAKLIPIDSDPVPSLYGSMKGTVHELGDIVSPLDVGWDAARDE